MTSNSIDNNEENKSSANPETLQVPPPAIVVRPPSPETLWAEIVIAFNYLTRFDLALRSDPPARLIPRSMGWFPAVGALIGLFGASIDWIMAWLGMPAIITATFAIIGMLWFTRAMHEEELASLINQYNQALDRQQKIGWLREQRSVSHGTLAVISIIIIKIGALANLNSSDLVWQTLLVAGAWSRALMVPVAAWLRPLGGDPVADRFQRPSALRVMLALSLGIIIAAMVFGSDAASILGASSVVAIIIALIGAHYLRGYNGRLLGTVQQVVEVTVMGVILALQ